MNFFSKLMSQQPMISAACGSHIGKKRDNNEDNYYFNGEYLPAENNGTENILTVRVLQGEDSFFAVLDGMGGYEYGEIASNTAAVESGLFFADSRNINPCDITPSLSTLCRKLNEKVFNTGHNLGASQMGTTLVSLFFHKDQVWICNVGDSRCYLLRDGEMRQLSKDHTNEEELRIRGITDRKPYLTQYVGMDPEELTVVPYITSLYFREGDRFLLCSDGLTDMVSEGEICKILVREENSKECVEELINTALAGGGKDNITAIVIEII